MRVVLASDGSDCAAEAAHFLETVKFGDQPQLTLLTVTYDPDESGRKSHQPWAPSWRESQKQFVEELHEKLEQQLGGQFESMSRVHLNGHVAHQIVQHASDHDADLIVLGAVGHSMISRLILGSVSDTVATHSPCSVAVIRPPKNTSAATTYRKIMVAYDGSKSADDAVTELSRHQWHPDCEITVLTVVQEPDYLLAGGISTSAIVNEEQVFEAMKTSCDKATNRIAEALPNARSMTVKGHHVGDTIVRAADEQKADLLVIGDAGHNLVDELIIGSTTKYVLRHAHCGVWISRHGRQ